MKTQSNPYLWFKYPYTAITASISNKVKSLQINLHRVCLLTPKTLKQNGRCRTCSRCHGHSRADVLWLKAVSGVFSVAVRCAASPQACDSGRVLSGQPSWAVKVAWHMIPQPLTLGQMRRREGERCRGSHYKQSPELFWTEVWEVRKWAVINHLTRCIMYIFCVLLVGLSNLFIIAWMVNGVH
jgi:hypothetical protein